MQDAKQKHALVVDNLPFDWLTAFVIARLHCPAVSQSVAFGDRVEPDTDTERPGSSLRSCGDVSDLRHPSLFVVAKFVEVVAVAAGDSDQLSVFVVGVRSLRISVRRIPAPFENLAISIKNCRARIVNDRSDWSTKLCSFTVGG